MTTDMTYFSWGGDPITSDEYMAFGNNTIHVKRRGEPVEIIDFDLEKKSKTKAALESYKELFE